MAAKQKASRVRVDQLGRWIGDPVDGPLTGTDTTGFDFTRSCPRDYAVSGFRAISRDAALSLNIISSFSYTVEMLIQAGIADDNPRVRELFYAALIKRGSRFFAEIGMHTGEMTLDEANA